MARRKHPFYISGQNRKPTKRELYILELVSCVVTAAIAYQIGKTFDNHSAKNGIFHRRRLISLSSSIRHMSQTKIVIKIGIFFESYKEKWPKELNLFTFLHYLETMALKVQVVNRAHALEYLGVQDIGQSRAWINRAIPNHIKTVVIDPNNKPLRAAMDSLRFRRNKSEAHRSIFTKAEALDITWNEILVLVEASPARPQRHNTTRLQGCGTSHLWC
jgi:hypothetical protein